MQEHHLSLLLIYMTMLTGSVWETNAINSYKKKLGKD